MGERAAKLVSKLRKGIDKTLEVLGSLEPGEWYAVLYAEPYPWTVRDLLAHFVSAEEGLLRLAQDVAAGGPGAPLGFDYDDFNAREQRRLAHVPREQLLEDLIAARRATVAWVETLEQTALDRKGHHPALGEITVETFLNAIYGHQLMHIRDLVRVMDRSKATALPASSRSGVKSRKEIIEEEAMAETSGLRVQAAALKHFCVEALQRLDVVEEDARITADVLVAADLRGISSHGVARLRRYVNGLRDGVMIARPDTTVVTETPTTILIDAGGGLGQPVSYRAMETAIEKAKISGSGFATVRDSNHYGIAGYYSMMALEHDCIGISMTNAAVLVLPTFGRDAMLGTNPISVAAPAGEERPFVLDMATSTVPSGKLEVYRRLEKPLPLGWATDETGTPTDDTGAVLDNLKERAGGGLLPLGGAGELLGGHKGYGLSLLVDVLCGVLPGAAYANLVYPKDEEGAPLPSAIGHFFGAWRVDAFRPVEAFKAAMDDLQRRLKNAPKAKGQDRIYVHGEKEYEEAERNAQTGIPLNPKVAADLKAIGNELGVEYDLA